MTEGIDYSYSRPKPAEIVAAKKKFVVRYVTPPGKGNKGIDQAEYDALKQVGLEIVAVWEGAAKDALGGYAQGVGDAKAAQAGLKGVVGLNDRLPVYFAIDWDATPAEMQKVQGYFDGVLSVLGAERTGVYAGATQLQAIRTAKKASWFWQTYAWSKGIVLPGIHLYQYRNGVTLGSGQVDYVRSLQSNYGQKGVAPKAPTVTASLVGKQIEGTVELAVGAKVTSATLTVTDSNGKKTTAKVSL